MDDKTVEMMARYSFAQTVEMKVYNSAWNSFVQLVEMMAYYSFVQMVELRDWY